MERLVQPEWLDELPAADARAVRARKDLLRINLWMGNIGILVRTLRSAFPGRAPGRLVELGAGDGRVLCRVAARLPREWKGTSVLLLDRQVLVLPQVLQTFAQLGWRLETLKADALEWLRQPVGEVWGAMVANLFLHHFAKAQLAELLSLAAKRTQVFIAIEPRRSRWALASSRLVGLIGCNAVTRYDARVSVRAGFAGRELSALWPGGNHWRLEERPAGSFSHLFVARLKESAP